MIKTRLKPINCRLKQVDLDSSYEFSNFIHVLFLEKQLEQLTIFQKNENKTVIGQLQLKQAGNYQVNIRNSHGQLVYDQEQQLQEGMNEFKSELPMALKTFITWS
ncbi:MAG: hypothetical protein BRD49_03515 [Bacteroidetes bacterium SW_10_40_5]|nr:MAG: hypothetical protein BRD49_03515 [Bacteroidetes bacterium SW_10_40_5]